MRLMRRYALAALVLWVVFVAVSLNCGPHEKTHEVIVPEIGVRLLQGTTYTTPCDGWFLSDSELKNLFMEEYHALNRTTP